MTPEQEKKLNHVSDRVDQLYAAFVGNETMGQKGIIKRLSQLEREQEKYKTQRNRIIGGVAVGTPILVIIWHWIEQKYLR